MKNNHIQTYSFWEIYRQLPQDEAKNFVSFVESAYHNSNRRLIPLAKEFHDVHKKKVPPHRESIWQKSFSARYNNQVFKNNLSELKKLLTEFLLAEWLNQNAEIKNFALSDCYLKKGLLKQFKKISPVQNGELKSNSGDSQFYLFRTNQLKDEYAAALAPKRRYDLLEPVMNDFNQYYFLETMRMYCEALNRKNLRSQDFDEGKMKLFIDYFHAYTKGIILNPLIEMYYCIFKFISGSEDEKSFSRYKELITQNVGLLPLHTARELCLYGQNQCVKYINLNSAFYLKELFDLYNLMIGSGIIYEGQYMTQYTFKNYVTVALRLKEFDAAIEFVEKYREALHPDHRFNAYHYNLAAIYFENHDFGKAMDALNFIQLSDPVYYLDSRSILLKIYFDEKDFEALASLYHAVRAYLLRSRQFPRKQADLYRYLFLYTVQLSRIMIKSKMISGDDLHAQLTELKKKVTSASVANKSWLLGKIAEQLELKVV